MRIMGSQTVHQPSSHTVYNVQCSAGVVRWEVRKRFSDFVQVKSHFSASRVLSVDSCMPSLYTRELAAA